MKLHNHLKQFSDEVTESSEELTNNGSHTNYTQDLRINFDHSNFTTFKVCQFSEDVKVTSSISGVNFLFENCVFIGQLELSNLSGNVTFRNCFFVKVTTTNIPSNLLFEGCSDLDLNIISNISAVKIIKSIVKNLTFNNSSISSLEIDYCVNFGVLDGDFCNDLVIGNSTLEKIEIEKSSHIKISSSDISEIILTLAENNYFHDLKNRYLKIEGIEYLSLLHSKLHEVHLSGLKIRNLKILKSSAEVIELLQCSVINSDAVIIDNVLVSSSFCVMNSKLQVANIDYLILRSAMVKLFDVDFEFWKLGKVDWPTGYDIDLGESKTFSKSLIQRDFYRELKRKSIEIENQIDAGYFRGKETYFHYMYIKELSKEFRRINGFWKFLGNNIFSELFILWTNRVFSGFGGNVWRPLLIGIAFHFVFFNLFLISFDGFGLRPFYVDLSSPELNLSLIGVVKFLELFNPLHTFSDSAILNSWQLLIDIVMRVSSGYFIFYILRASRKFAK